MSKPEALVSQFRGQAQTDIVDGVGNYSAGRLALQKAVAALMHSNIISAMQMRLGHMFSFRTRSSAPAPAPELKPRG